MVAEPTKFGPRVEGCTNKPCAVAPMASAAGASSPMVNCSSCTPSGGSTPAKIVIHGGPETSCPLHGGNHCEIVLTERSTKACSPGAPRAISVALDCSAAGEENSRLCAGPPRSSRPEPETGVPVGPHEQVTPGISE